ncbi:amidase [Rhodococcus hoagii]|uniref:amidase n=1 Tax=Rhodococcus hoagii TaxID=43767 RepID=A0AAE2W994_RHOHA|nr:amidase [Prescottella equi]MBM4716132.1 amidase [Prescottella equi]NKS14314.1 amidase [Prescottella equi]
MAGFGGGRIGSTARDIARAITGREVSARAVIEEHLDHIGNCNARWNAVVTVPAEQALAAADRLDRRLAHGDPVGPLAGVPFTVKDLIATAGVRTTAGSRALAGNVPAADAPAVAAMKRAGAILVGKTNTPEFGASGLTHNDLFGYTRNPLGTEADPRSPGGSSGGEAAALAAGMSAVGLGTDFGGSVRWPAHCTGLSSIRPTSGRVSADGQYPGVAAGDRVLANPATVHGVVQTIGPLARTLDDAALVLRVVSSRRFRWADPADVEVDGLDITWAGGEGTVPVEAGIVAAVAETAGGLGARRYAGSALPRANDLFGRLRATETAADIEAYGAPSDFGANIRAVLAAASERRSHRDVEELWAQRARLTAGLLDEMGDVLVLPVASITAPPLGLDTFTVDGHSLTWQDALACCRAISVTGLPSVVVPVATAADGLPIGVQVIARPWQEHVALAVAHRVRRTSTYRSPHEEASRCATS